mmetsp:Transcript_25166/g.74832  ORF Transcript_25166/g.74832 Transcript_25166/m.74832 type:complete len:265 (+) Transcript_25166:1112-1906(+)
MRRDPRQPVHTIRERSLRRAGRPLRAQLRQAVRVRQAVPEWGGGRGRGPELRGRDEALAFGKPSPQVDAKRLALLQDARARLAARETLEGPRLLADHAPHRRLPTLRHVVVDGPVHRAAGVLAGADARLRVRREVAEFAHVPLTALLRDRGVAGGRGCGEMPGLHDPGHLQQDLLLRLLVLEHLAVAPELRGHPVDLRRRGSATDCGRELGLPVPGHVGTRDPCHEGREQGGGGRASHGDGPMARRDGWKRGWGLQSLILPVQP